MSVLRYSRLLCIMSAMMLAVVNAYGEHQSDTELDWELSSILNTGSGDFAPHYISSLRHGKVSQTNSFVLGAGAWKQLRRDYKFSWGAGVEIDGGIASRSDYRHWNADGAETVSQIRPSTLWIQQLYAELKWRSLFFEAGMKERVSALLNDKLTSGDLVESGNARPIPQIRAGFVDFQNIPLTEGWLQIQGELGYGKFADGGWMKKFYNYGSYHLNSGAYYLYRRLYLRTNQSKKLSVTFGMQAAGEIGGVTKYYERGQIVRTRNLKPGLWNMIKMIVPAGGSSSGVGEYMDGNNLGSWDIFLKYKLPWNEDVLKAYLQKPWEKGSSIGWKNGWDGLWGIEYDFGCCDGIITGIAIEYLDFMNQSGAIHYAPHDQPGSTITTDVSGGDQYYNNYEYNSYTNYGMGIGSPFLMSPRYNLDGYPGYIDTRVRGFHAALIGRPAEGWSYRMAISHKKGYGDGRQPRATVGKCTSWLVEVERDVKRVKGLTLKLQIAADHGNMPCDNFGMALSGVYRGEFSMKRTRK